MKKILTNKKTIVSDGANHRVAQACDRCRAKKTKCDGRNPCTPCQLVGLECVVSDKLSRRAFPKGYTETLEERIRQLEAENKKLATMLDLRDEQLELQSKRDSDDDDPLGPHLTLTNLHLHDMELACPCGCANPLAHGRPELLAGLVYEPPPLITGLIAGSLHDLQVSEDADDFDIAPHAFAAATAIAKMNHENKQTQHTQQLTQLVAILSPRLTEETLFIPTLLARICQQYGYLSRQAVLTANCLALLKRPDTRSVRVPPALELVMNRDVLMLSEVEAVQFIYGLGFPPKLELDRLITMYFQEWELPIVDRTVFLRHYCRITEVLETGRYQGSPSDDYESIEKVGATLVVVVALALLLAGANADVVARYHRLVHEFVKPLLIITAHSLMQLLQILTLCLEYCLVVGDIATAYELRGRAITMAQQLRLHRCPAAVLGVLGTNDVHTTSRQAERRILFWCVYVLDVYSSLNLGVPRLLKDFEIECAMPFTNNDEGNNVNILVINNTRLPIVGKVLKMAHLLMSYAKVLGSVLDLVFSRYDHAETQEKAVERDRMLETWRRDLAPDLRFEVDINGFPVKAQGGLLVDDTIWRLYLKPQLILIFAYFHAKILIYLPMVSKYGNHHNVGLSQKEQLTRGEAPTGLVLVLGLMVQQLLIQILEVLRLVGRNSLLTVLPLPLNICQEQARFALMVAKGLLDYTKGGLLYQHSKQLLVDTIGSLGASLKSASPGTLSREASKLLELSILLILGVGSPKPKKRVPYTTPALARDPTQATTPMTLAPAMPQFDFKSATPEYDDIEAILNFDPYKINAQNNQLFMNEFAADGSFGLVPLLDNWANNDDLIHEHKTFDNKSFLQ